MSPRFFAESFFNNKDLALLSIYLIAIDAAIIFILSPSILKAIYFGAMLGLAIDVRIIGLVLLILCIFVYVIDSLKKRKKFVNNLICLIASCLVVVLVFWPWLWTDPINKIKFAFINMALHPGGNMWLSYLGEKVWSTRLPWHYVPVWIIVTTPIVYLSLFLVGAGSTLRAIYGCRFRLWSSVDELQDFIFITLFFLPIVAVITLNSTLYNGWRHLYFIYPSFLLLSTKGWLLLRDHHYTQPFLKKWVKPILTTILCISLAWIALWMIKAHPLQNLYFNALVGKNWKNKFDLIARLKVVSQITLRA